MMDTPLEKELQIKAQIADANFERMRFMSFIFLSYAIYFVISDFLGTTIWPEENLNLYKVLDSVFAFLSTLSIIFFWLYKKKNYKVKYYVTFVFILLGIIYFAAISGIEVSSYGYSTMMTALIISVFFVYADLLMSITIFSTALIAFIMTLALKNHPISPELPIIIIIVDVSVISIMVAYRNYNTKRDGIISAMKMNEYILELNYYNDRLEQKVNERTEELMFAKEKAEESDRLKSAFLSNLSHEIRTPMNGILGFSSLLTEPGLSTETQQEYIQMILTSGERMTNIISEIVAISKIESGMIDIYDQRVDVNELGKSILEMFKSDAANKNIELNFRNNLVEHNPVIVTDVEKLRTILSYLVKNAIKYTDYGFVEFGYYCLDNETICTANDNCQAEQIMFFVEDSGIGIPANRQKAIFDRFVQSDLKDIQARQGAGLGLTIAKAYVELLGGKIWVESEVSIGTTFFFILPLDADIEPANHQLPIKSMLSVGSLVRQINVLIIDDDQTNDPVLLSMIQKFCRKLFLTNSAEEAQNIVALHPDINLIVLDTELIDSSILGFLSKIRTSHPEIVIFIPKSHTESKDQTEALQHTIHSFISKPYSRYELMRLLMKYFIKNS